MKAADIPVSSREIYRYLGYRGIAPSPEITAEIEKCLELLRRESLPQSVRASFQLESPGENILVTAGMEIHSKSLWRNMKGCTRCCLFAATIGIGCDRLIARAELTSMLDAAIYQAAGAALVEGWCDVINREIADEAAAEGYYARPRFSPGYGDFSLSHQRDFERILQMSKHCGITLSDSLLMTPSKSVTAMVGLSTMKTPCVIQGCESCENAPDCAFRR